MTPPLTKAEIERILTTHIRTLEAELARAEAHEALQVKELRERIHEFESLWDETRTRMVLLEAELAFWLRESTKWNAERDALASLNESKNTTIDALKARVAELEAYFDYLFGPNPSVVAQREFLSRADSSERGGGRESGKAEARAGAVRRDDPEAVRDRSAVAKPPRSTRARVSRSSPARKE